MVFAGAIMGLVPGFMALGILGQAARVIPQNIGSAGGSAFSGAKSLIGPFVGIMAGTAMLGAVGSQIGGLSFG